MYAKARLLELMAGVHFQDGADLETPEQFVEMLRHNAAEYAKIEAMGEEHVERIRGLICLLIAEAIQGRVIERYGNADAASVLAYLKSEFSKVDRGEIDRLLGLARQAVLTPDLSASQSEAIGKLIDFLPRWLAAFAADEIARLKFIPVGESSEIATVLARMIEEAKHADTVRDT